MPACYRHDAPRLVPAYFSKFLPDTLFYIVYSMPGDEAQALAAEELTHRGWYFHKELKGWITAVPNTEPAQKTDRCALLACSCRICWGCWLLVRECAPVSGLAITPRHARRVQLMFLTARFNPPAAQIRAGQLPRV